MPPKKRKSKQLAEDEEPNNVQRASKRRTKHVETEDVQHSVLGGMKGGYRLDGKETTNTTTNDEHEVQHFNIPFKDKSIICERRHSSSHESSSSDEPTLIFTHGAGGGLANPATKDFADGFAEVAGIVSFQGTMNLQSRVKTFRAVFEHEGFGAALGGRSMGARAAVLAATDPGGELGAEAVVLVSFPLVGGKKKDSRERILLDLPETVDVLFVSGTKDTMCDLEHLAKVRGEMKAKSWFVRVEGADHSMSWKWKEGVEAMRRKTGAVAAEWLRGRNRAKRACTISWDEDRECVACSDWQGEGEEEEEKAPPAKKKRKAK